MVLPQTGETISSASSQKNNDANNNASSQGDKEPLCELEKSSSDVLTEHTGADDTKDSLATGGTDNEKNLLH